MRLSLEMPHMGALGVAIRRIIRLRVYNRGGGGGGGALLMLLLGNSTGGLRSLS